MGKKRIIKKGESSKPYGVAASPTPRGKRKLDSGILFVEATFNNTKLALADKSGNVVSWSSSGSLGFSFAKKGPPCAAAKGGELLGGRAAAMGVKEVSVTVKGVGAGRESAIRAFSTKGIQISSIKDVTPVPHNGPRPPKARRI